MKLISKNITIKKMLILLIIIILIVIARIFYVSTNSLEKKREYSFEELISFIDNTKTIYVCDYDNRSTPCNRLDLIKTIYNNKDISDIVKVIKESQEWDAPVVGDTTELKLELVNNNKEEVIIVTVSNGVIWVACNDSIYSALTDKTQNIIDIIENN